MGDYTNKGEKIGTTGTAYYATKEMLQKLVSRDSKEQEAAYYLDPKNKCQTAFPFPEYDGLTVGKISTMGHTGSVHATYIVRFKGGAECTHHKQVVMQKQPVGAPTKNIYANCPYVADSAKEDVLFRLMYESYDSDLQPCIVAECVYCGALNVLEKYNQLYVSK